MGRRVTQKLHEIALASADLILRNNPLFPVFFFFATTPGDNGSNARLDMIRKFCEQRPQNGYVTDKRLEFYPELMAAADFNLMTSLTEPHGGCFDGGGPAIPICRAQDGPPAQFPAFEPVGIAAKLNEMWHGRRSAAGWTTREELSKSTDEKVSDLSEILERAPWVDNATTRSMSHGFAATIIHAVNIQRNAPHAFASITREALRIQIRRSWLVNYGAMFSHIAGATIRRPLS
jgi:hypothetical protein